MSEAKICQRGYRNVAGSYARNKNPMQALPFLLPPYPDEIFGSWIARNRLHNADGAWRIFAGNAGTIPFDMPTFSPGLESLLERMGMDYEEMLLSLTTLPYWLSFGAGAPEDGMLPGTFSLPLLQSDRSNSHCTKLRKVMVRHRAESLMQYCAHCIESDRAVYGEPFWHRSHQLPTVFYCPKHCVLLRSRCPECGSTITGGMQSLSVCVLPMSCSCGFFLAQGGSPTQLPELVPRLNHISLEALTNRQFLCERRQFREMLRSRLAARGDATALISEALGQIASCASLHHDRISEERLAWIRARSKPYVMRAPEMCIIFAALEISLPVALREAEQFPRENPGRSYLGQKLGLSVTEKSAKDALLQRRKSHPSMYVYNRGINYWAVRILAPDWYKANFPHAHGQPLPTIHEDRTAIQNSLARANPSSLSSPSCLGSAGQRARIRDGDWLGRQWRKRFLQPANPPRGRSGSDAKTIRPVLRHPRGSPTLRQAKATLLQYRGSCRASATSRLEYWTVRLCDPQWLIKNFPNSVLSHLPSIRQDRKSIRLLLSAPQTVNSKETHQWGDIGRIAAGFRARIRDSAWLSKARNQFLQLRWRNSRPNPGPKRKTSNQTSPAPARDRLRALYDALDATVRQTGFPTMLTIPLLAKRAGLSFDVAKSIVRDDENLRQAILEARQNVPHRRLQWGIAKILAEHRPLTVTSLIRVSKVRDSSLARSMIDQARL